MWRELGSGNGFGYANLVMEATWDRETGNQCTASVAAGRYFWSEIAIGYTLRRKLV